MKYALLIIILLAAFFALLPQPGAELNLPSQNFVVRNVKLFDGEQVLPSTDVLVKAGMIETVATKLINRRNYPELDGQGKTLIPGLIDAHTRVWGTALSEALNFGVTTELDMFSSPTLMNSLQQRRNEHTNAGFADVFSATILATAPKGHGTEYGIDIPVITDPKQAKAFVAQRIAQGADYLKIVYNAPDSPYHFSPSISLETLSALVKQAHMNNLLAIVHVDNLLSAKQAVKAGIDGLVHSFMDQVVDDELINLMKHNQVFIIPTLTVQASLAQVMPGQSLLGDSQLVDYINAGQLASLKSPFLDLGFKADNLLKAKQSVTKLQRAGIVILAGTDAPNPGTAHGVSLHEELKMLVEAGLTPLQALKAATVNVHNTFDVGYRGTLSVGQPATMVLVEGDPTQDIKRVRHISAIWKNGQWFKREITTPDEHKSQVISAGLITDFNQSDISTNWGKGIGITQDKSLGGQSTATLQLNQDEGYLNVSGEVKQGYAYPWAGIQFFTAKSPGQSVDLSQLQQLEFRAKGNITTLYLMMFQKGSFQPVIQTIKLSQQWQTHRINLKDFKNANLNNVTALAWVASQTKQTFEFALDDLELR